MRDLLPGISMRINQISIGGSTTIVAAGANVLVAHKRGPARALTLTSTYLADSNGAIAVT